ncbi:carbohydrate ABC transporter permease [Nocardioides iriomotensis]|uniref:Sugar ABC transporter permease n=1 Tax=Nocardioides iriomotensis TaxID=715784 RepID=A0A4Q5J6C1_9ACTN|nr:sugar ABC transporter permease [Nocardioides iriomotensis]RYU14202.1 sugar ABC transporter permease [Nocardioides iriomotensis]
MWLKAINTILTVIVGIGVAVLLYWLLNKIAELLPSRLEDKIKPWLYILPAYLALVVYLIYPTIVAFIKSFQDATSTEWVGFANFEALLTNAGFQQTLFNTVLWMIIVPTVTIILGLGIAVLADRLQPRYENLSKTIVFMPMAISMVGAATVWRFVYAYRPAGSDQVGLQNAIITSLGGDPVPWLQQSQFHLNSLLLMVMLLWAQIGFGMVLLSGAIKGVPTDTLEAARIDGADERQTFFRVVVPQIKGTIVTVFITTLISAMKTFDVVYVMTSGQFNTNILGVEFYRQLTSNFNNGAASAIVVLLLIATFPVMLYQVKHFREEAAR